MKVDINSYINKIYDKISWGGLKYSEKVNHKYYFRNENQEVCYNLYLESISVHELSEGGGKNWVLYLDKNNVDKGVVDYDEYLFNSLFELILRIVMGEEELNELEAEMEMYAQKEHFEKATKMRDIINNIKNLMNSDD